VRNVDIDKITAAADECLERMKSYVPGCRYKLRPILKDEKDDIVMLAVEVEGAGDYLPKTAGNLDIINAAAIRIAEAKAKQLLEVKA